MDVSLETGAQGRARVKPRFRGVSHQYAAFLAAGAGLWLVSIAPNLRAGVSAAVYAASLTGLLGMSALYHRPYWHPMTRLRLQRIDHAMIFVLIAGTYTPICLLALQGAAHTLLLWFAWIGAAVGILRAVVWPNAPRAVRTGIYLALGWMAVAYAPMMRKALSTSELAALIAGGLLYTVGAVVYATRRPNPVPGIFGYHEVFHALVIAAAASHFACIAALIRSAS